jgi:HEAT repeat protein
MNRRTPYASKSDDRAWSLHNTYQSLSHARLLRLLRDPDLVKRRAAALALAHRRNSKAVFRDCLRLGRNDDPLLREQAAVILGWLRYPNSAQGEEKWQKATTLLRELALNDPGAYVRVEALRALKHCGMAPADFPEIAQRAAHDTSSTVRAFAAALISSARHCPGTEESLERLLHDKDKVVRDWAAHAVYNRIYSARYYPDQKFYDTPEIRNTLLRLTDDPHEPVRFESLRALGALREKRVAPALLKALSDEEEIDFDLVEAAGDLGDPALIPVLEKALELFGDDKRDRITSALERLRGEEAATGENHDDPAE